MVLLRLSGSDGGNQAKVIHQKMFYQILLPSKVALCHPRVVEGGSSEDNQQQIKCGERRHSHGRRHRRYWRIRAKGVRWGRLRLKVYWWWWWWRCDCLLQRNRNCWCLYFCSLLFVVAVDDELVNR